MRKKMQLDERGLHSRYTPHGVTERLLCVLIAVMVTGLGAFAAPEGTITGTADDTAGVYLFSAGTDAQDCGDGTPAGEPTDDIIQEAIDYSVLELAGDTAAEIVGFTTGPNESNDDGSRDSTQSAVLTGLSDIDDFGLIGNSGDNDANFDSGKGGSVTLQLISGYVVQADGVIASGTIGPENAGSAAAADAALGGFEIFIFEDAELSGMTITLTSQLGQYVIQVSDRQIDPNTDSGADDTLIAIDLDSLPNWDGTYISQVTVQDDDSAMSSGSCGRYGDTSMELDAVAMRTSALVQPASIGDYVWLDIDEDGIQDGTESGINNVTVELYDSGNTLVGTTNTSGGGAYSFSGLTPGDYYVKFYLPTTNYTFSPQNQGGDDELDSDADTSSGETAVTTLVSGENDLSWDAGMYIPATLVTLSSFGATVSDGQVVVQWSTSSEQNALGFYLERLDDQSGEFVRVNADLIPASIFSTGTVDYQTADADAVPGETYQYRLVELETTGKVNTYGPYTVSTEGSAGADEGGAGATAVEQIEEAAPEVTGLTAGSGHMVLRWSSAEGNTYRIERSDSAGGEFEVIASGIPATAPENVLVLVDGADSGFYRIVSE